MKSKHSGKSKAAAIVAAASVRLRPILMTTAAMVWAYCRWCLRARGCRIPIRHWARISTGLAIGTLFTLFVVPGVYMHRSRSLRSQQRKSRRIF